jgi:hypothetical protein
MKRVDHIINPVKVNQTHELYIAQPITFVSMQRASLEMKASERPGFLALHYSEDEEIIPDFFKKGKLPEGGIRQFHPFENKAKLPLLREILQTAFVHSVAEYLIYTNADIAVQPHFYSFIHSRINQGIDAFMINRRRIPFGNFTPADLEKLYTTKGKSHPGFDCFVFPRKWIPEMILGDICIGIPFTEATLAHNLFALSKNFRLFDKEYLTFHLGMEIFKKRDKELYWHNRNEFFKKIKPALWAKWNISQFPYYERGFPMRYLKWAANPALFTLMNLKLELRERFTDLTRR